MRLKSLAAVAKKGSLLSLGRCALLTKMSILAKLYSQFFISSI